MEASKYFPYVQTLDLANNICKCIVTDSEGRESECKKKIPKTGGTSNIRRHLLKHPEILERIDNSQPISKLNQTKLRVEVKLRAVSDGLPGSSKDPILPQKATVSSSIICPWSCECDINLGDTIIANYNFFIIYQL